MRTRSGAASWVKRQLCNRIPQYVGGFAATTLSKASLATAAAVGFATRWNVGAFKFQGERAVLSRLYNPSGSLPVISETTNLPLPKRRLPPSRTAFLDAAPDYNPPGVWTASTILEYLPSGAAGPDAISVDWLRSASFDTLDRLALLLNLVDGFTTTVTLPRLISGYRPRSF